MLKFHLTATERGRVCPPAFSAADFVVIRAQNNAYHIIYRTYIKQYLPEALMGESKHAHLLLNGAFLLALLV